MWRPLWQIRITHLPTGTVVQTDELGGAMRSMYKAKQKLMEVLSSKVNAPSKPTGLVRTYDMIEDAVVDG
jgi:protein subunit release factor A